jgi:hypothetical protein
MINDQKIEVVEKYKYLGVILTYNWNLKHAADQLCNKALKATFSLKSKILDFDFSEYEIEIEIIWHSH